MSSKAYLTWALNQEGDLVHVDEVSNAFVLIVKVHYVLKMVAMEKK